jgi:hypothetical protein
MVDIETLGTGNHAAVISVGIVAFDESSVLASDGWAIRSADWHGDIDPDTVRWWMQQESAARNFSSGGEYTATTVALKLAEFMGQHRPEEVWANDPSFDVVILKNWWKRCNTGPLKFPIDFRSERSFRTIKAEARRLGIDMDQAYRMNATAHNPVDDAANQARAVILVRSRIAAAPWDVR